MTWFVSLAPAVVRSRSATLLLASAALVAVGCKKPAAPTRPPVAVTVATSARGAAPYVVTANGLVEPQQSVALQSQVGGVLLAVHFREGDEVQQGQLLFTIDRRPYEAALLVRFATLWFGVLLGVVSLVVWRRLLQPPEDG